MIKSPFIWAPIDKESVINQFLYKSQKLAQLVHLLSEPVYRFLRLVADENIEEKSEFPIYPQVSTAR